MEQNVLSRIIDYYFSESRFEEDIIRASLQFFDIQSIDELSHRSLPEESDAWFTDWFLYDYTFANGTKPLEYFIRVNPLHLSHEQLVVYTQLQQNHFSFFEVLSVKRGTMIHVRDTQNGTEYRVSERMGTYDVHEGNLIFARVARIGDQWEFIGADFLRWDIRIGDFLRERLLGDTTHLSPMHVYKLMSDWQSKKEGQGLRRTEEGIVEFECAEQMLSEYLKTYDLEEMVSIDVIKGWIQKALDKDLPLYSPHTMLSGLVDPARRNKENMNMLVMILSSIHAHIQNQKKKLRRATQSSHPRIDAIPLGGSAWYDHDEKARQYLHHGKHRDALHAYNACFEAFLKEQTTMREVYRIFANKAMAHIAIGDEYAAQRFLEISLELNPNYDFAIASLRKLQSGELQKDMSLNALRDALEQLQDPDNPWNKWNFDEIRNTWSEERILNELGTRGISMSKNEFREKARSYIDRDAFIKEQLEPRYRGAEEDVDLVYVAGYALWDRWCPDYFTPVQFFESIDRLNAAIYETEDQDGIGREMGALEQYVGEASDDVFGASKKNVEYSLVATLASCFVDLLHTPFHDRALVLARALRERTGYLPFDLIAVCDAIMMKKPWQEWYDACMNDVGFDSFPFVLVGDVLCEEGLYGDAQRVYHEGLARTQEREKKHAPRSVHGESLYDAYERVYNALEELYRRMEDSEKKKSVIAQMRLLQERKEELDRLDEYESVAFDSEEAVARLEQFQEERFLKDPAARYYEFLKKFSIIFATKELTKSKWSAFSYDGKEKKIGRNDPCLCGARDARGKILKWKKCHGA